MDSILQAAVRKKSFELNYNDGIIWCELFKVLRNQGIAVEFISDYEKAKQWVLP